ncbi:uncharacterized protein LOC124448004 [Xenia sp. Carnegie-2017]|uniref:uncharacterized protein LOC124448004 n=1 Tax=Xenia sp. Carnegie-2017 TaxID=2897299 RepID=UPI001F047100|nr:uncharacterized protein LOC124448004 [Xenia sp. Carnegie-2017]
MPDGYRKYYSMKRDAEKLFEKFLYDSGLPRESIFPNLRIPDFKGHQKREIDFILIHVSGIYTLEIKNWSGNLSLSADGQKWIQSRSGGRESVEYGNVLTSLENKTQVLRKYLFKKNITIRKDYLKPRVIFMNNKIHIDERIGSKPEVILPNKRNDFINGFLNGSLLPNDQPLPKKLQSKVVTVLKNVSTWDVMHLNGGQQLYGDLKCSSVDRNAIDYLVFSHKRDLLKGCFLALWGRSPYVKVSPHERGKNTYQEKYRIPIDEEFIFRECGHDADTSIQANEIDKIQLSI